MKTLEEILAELKGKTIKSVEKANDADCGLFIHFTDGTRLSFGYSGYEGHTTYNYEEIEELA
jgi:hypothetical protein